MDLYENILKYYFECGKLCHHYSLNLYKTNWFFFVFVTKLIKGKKEKDNRKKKTLSSRKQNVHSVVLDQRDKVAWRNIISRKFFIQCGTEFG